MRILIIEDESALRRQLADRLARAGMDVEETGDGAEGLYLASEYAFDAAVVDLGLPGVPGLDVIRRLRARGSQLPILILTARGSWQEKVEGLEAGADDYLTKPFQPEELLARLRALLRRAAGAAGGELRCGPLRMDLVAQKVRIGDREPDLTAFEYRLLEHLVTSRGKVLSKQELADRLYPHDEDRDSNVLEVLVGRLRRKLDPDGSLSPIETLRGRGYRFALGDGWRRMKSLRARVALSAAVVLAIFILLTSLALEHAFQDSARSAREQRLLGQLYLLMAAAEAEDGTLAFPSDQAEPRLGLPESGLYAAVMDEAGNRIWESRSNIGLDAPLHGPLPPGRVVFDQREGADGRDYFVERFGVTWATGPLPVAYTFAIAEDLGPYQAELAGFRTGLAGWLGAMSLLTLAALVASLRWGLAPMGRVADEVAEIEAGRQERIRGEYPSELKALTDNLNALLAHERAQQARLQNTLGDLAHSLKTPLAVMRGALDPQDLDPETAELMDEQLSRMNHMVAYQLQRARAGAAAGLAPRVPLARAAERLAASMAKVYREKDLQIDLRIEPCLVFRGAEEDLTELLGNLMDNACKWARRRVRVSADEDARRLRIWVEDDGPGIPPDQARQVLERGSRLDQATPGHGIGLAVARDICVAYGGAIDIHASALGGASVQARVQV